MFEVRPRIRRRTERVHSRHVIGYDADLIASVSGLVLVAKGEGVPSGTVYPLFLDAMLC